MDPNIILLLALPVIIIFFFLPQRKKAKAQENFTADLSKGDEVVTTSGIIGKVARLDENSVVVQTEQKTFIRFTRNAISLELTEAFFDTKSTNKEKKEKTA